MKRSGEINKASYDKAQEVIATGRAWISSMQHRVGEVQQTETENLHGPEGYEPSAVRRLGGGGATPGQLYR